MLQVEPSALKGNLTEGTFTFLPLGPVPALTLDEYRASVAAPPAQPVLETHRFQLSHVADHVRCKSCGLPLHLLVPSPCCACPEPHAGQPVVRTLVLLLPWFILSRV